MSAVSALKWRSAGASLIEGNDPAPVVRQLDWRNTTAIGLRIGAHRGVRFGADPVWRVTCGAMKMRQAGKSLMQTGLAPAVSGRESSLTQQGILSDEMRTFLWVFRKPVLAC